MFRLLGVTLLLITPLLAAPQFAEEVEGVDPPAAWSEEEEATTKHIDLEDPASWSASTEVLDENHAWYRRRRSVEGPGVDAGEEAAANVDLVAEESKPTTSPDSTSLEESISEECEPIDEGEPIEEAPQDSELSRR